jgi:RNA polymerase subunit RPABC4/transcription elongation factor Spt4
MRSCPHCHTLIQAGNRFCSECGWSDEASTKAASGVSLSGEAMVAGDVVGRKSETKVAGNYNVTNVSNIDDTKKVHRCAYSGEHLTFADVRTCPSCHAEVSSKCFEDANRRCFGCREAAEVQLKTEIESRYGGDFRIDAEEMKTLVRLQGELKIPRERYQQLEKEVRDKLLAERRYDYAEGKSAIPGIRKKIETATKAIAQRKPEVALKLLQPTWEECRDNKEYETVYFASLLLCEADALEAELRKFTYDDLSVDILKIRHLAANDSPEAAQTYMASKRDLSLAYRDEPDWRLLSVELSIDQALLVDEELLREGHLESARDELDIVEKLAGEESPSVGFVRGYLACVESAGTKREAVARWLESKLRSFQEAGELASAEVVKLCTAILGKLKLLKKFGVEAPVEKPPEAEPERPPTAPPVDIQCRHCGFVLPSNAQFCGSCGRASSPVRNFLESIGLGQYAELFDNNRIDETVITEISEQDLKNIGITSLGHRKRIAAAIADFDWPD